MACLKFESVRVSCLLVLCSALLLLGTTPAWAQVGVPCNTSSPPQCGGDCAPGLVCFGNTASDPCTCVKPCQDLTGPTCDGPCPNTADICVPNAAGTGCFCEPPPPCDHTLPPSCNGTCPNLTDICVPGPVGAPCKCEPPPPPCDQLFPPSCNGTCPSSTDICVPGPAGAPCHCEPPPCDQFFPPSCNGTCPNPADICVPGPVGAPCHCEPPPCDLTAPSCNGTCPDLADICVLNDAGTDCSCVSPPCEQTFDQCNGPCPNPQDTCLNTGAECICEPVPCDLTAQVCNGPCPNPLDTCRLNPHGDCFCDPPPPTPCVQGPFPQCGGFCPVFQACFRHPVTPSCVCCPVGIPTDLVTGVLFTSKVKIIWNPVPNPCPYTYNIYQKTTPVMPDSDSNGVADDYGTCLDFGLTMPEYVDMSPDPPPDWTHFYQVTVENQNGQEGSMGNASNLLPRPNVFPCP